MALGLCENVAGKKLLLHPGIKLTRLDVSHLPLGFPNELMAGENIPIGRYRHIFRPCSAAGNALFQAWAAGKVYHKMEEIKPAPRLAFGKQKACELIVFRKHLLHMLRPNRIGALLRQDNRFKGNLLKSHFPQCFYIV